jgi:hypothetical protein
MKWLLIIFTYLITSLAHITVNAQVPYQFNFSKHQLIPSAADVDDLDFGVVAEVAP